MGDLGPKGDPNLKKIRPGRDLKLEIFSAEGAEIFDKISFFIENWHFLKF